MDNNCQQEIQTNIVNCSYYRQIDNHRRDLSENLQFVVVFPINRVDDLPIEDLRCVSGENDVETGRMGGWHNLGIRRRRLRKKFDTFSCFLFLI